MQAVIMIRAQEIRSEFAARGGLESKRYVWGDEFKPGGKYMANTWQGLFPVRDTGEDGFIGTSPVGSFPSNGYGLYDMAGNVWQWWSDWDRVDTNLYAASKNVCRNPGGPAESYDPGDPYSLQRPVLSAREVTEPLMQVKWTKNASYLRPTGRAQDVAPHTEN
jgi:formylglycine-generating enzyme required for sulfatase activity